MKIKTPNKNEELLEFIEYYQHGKLTNVKITEINTGKRRYDLERQQIQLRKGENEFYFVPRFKLPKMMIIKYGKYNYNPKKDYFKRVYETVNKQDKIPNNPL